jgi:hypothetical protein
MLVMLQNITSEEFLADCIVDCRPSFDSYFLKCQVGEKEPMQLQNFLQENELRRADDWHQRMVVAVAEYMSKYSIFIRLHFKQALNLYFKI